MVEHVKRCFPVEGKNSVIRHPCLVLLDEAGERILKTYSPEVARIRFFEKEVQFCEPEEDKFYFYLLEKPWEHSDNNKLELIIGTKKTGDRLRLNYRVVRNPWLGSQVLYNHYFLWEKTNPGDENVRVASREKTETVYILENTYPVKGSYKEGQGYFSDDNVILNLDERGIITIIPESLTREKQKTDSSPPSSQQTPLPLLE